MKSFAENLKRLRKGANLTTSDLAAQLGVHVRMIEYYEAGEKVPRLPKLIELADFFHVSMDELLGRTVPKG